MSEYSRLPVDFEAKVKMPRPANGVGYPYQISARDLMANFRYLEDMESGGVPDGYAELDVNICVAGVPVSAKILARITSA